MGGAARTWACLGPSESFWEVLGGSGHWADKGAHACRGCGLTVLHATLAWARAGA